MKLETHAPRLTPAILKEWEEVIYDLTSDQAPIFNVCVGKIRLRMTTEDIEMLGSLNILEDITLIIDTDGQHTLIIRDTFELI